MALGYLQFLKINYETCRTWRHLPKVSKSVDVGAEIQTHLLSPGLIDFDGYSDYRIYNKDTNWLWGPGQSRNWGSGHSQGIGHPNLSVYQFSPWKWLYAYFQTDPKPSCLTIGWLSSQWFGGSYGSLWVSIFPILGARNWVRAVFCGKNGVSAGAKGHPQTWTGHGYAHIYDHISVYIYIYSIRTLYNIQLFMCIYIYIQLYI
jgi:hypothetical protein